MTSYPKWIYHKTAAPQIVRTPDEHAAMCPGWVESPADVDVALAPIAPVVPVALEPPADENVPAPVPMTKTQKKAAALAVAVAIPVE